GGPAGGPVGVRLVPRDPSCDPLTGLGVLAAGPRVFAYRFARLTVACGHGNVCERQDANEAFVPADHRQTPDLDIAHIVDDVLDVLVIEAVPYILRHDVEHLGIRTLALGNAANRDVAVSDHAYEPIIVGDRQDASVDSCHGHCCLLDRLVWIYDKDASRYVVGYYHVRSLHWSKGDFFMTGADH